MQDKLQLIIQQLEESARVKRALVESCAEDILRASQVIINSLRAGGRVFLCGNGGSAADSQHLAAELVGRLRRERGAIPAVALTTDTSVLTSLANDYSFEIIFARQLEALARRGDVLIGISTSGNSLNVIRAFEKAKEKGIHTIALLGGNGGKLKPLADYPIVVPSSDTQRIQEGHITIGHIICDLVERELTQAL